MCHAIVNAMQTNMGIKVHASLKGSACTSGI